jgi:RNA polymerase sigma factor (sigma-70 family)
MGEECTSNLAGRHARPVPVTRALDIDSIYRAHVRPLYAFIYGRVGNQQAAEDITADVFVSALTHLDPTREERSIVAWLYRVARNASTDYWRRAQGVQVTTLEEAWVIPTPVRPTDTVRHERTAAWAHALLARLPDNYRTVLTFRLLEGLSVTETAQRMGVSAANVKVMQHRALKRAAQLREDSVADEGGTSERGRPERHDTTVLVLDHDGP